MVGELEFWPCPAYFTISEILYISLSPTRGGLFVWGSELGKAVSQGSSWSKEVMFDISAELVRPLVWVGEEVEAGFKQETFFCF